MDNFYAFYAKIINNMDQPSPVFKDFINPDQLILQFAIKEGMNVADFGIGSGFFTILMAKVVGDSGSVAALDILEAPLEIVKDKALSEGLENINFARVDLEVERGSKLEDSSQDFVLIANILFQSKLKQDLLKEASRVAKLGANVVVIDWKKGNDALGGPPEELRISSEDIKSLSESIGLKFINNFEAGEYHYGLTFTK